MLNRETIGFYGLGQIGYPIAGRLARAGFSVAVSDLKAERMHAWQSEFGHAAHGYVEVNDGSRAGSAFKTAMSTGCRTLIGHVNL